MKRLNKSIPLDLIELTGGTQQRPLDTNWVEHIKALMRDGTEFPPVDVIFDGKYHWLWDGFHRVKAFQELGVTKIKANIQEGSKKDAQWMSFSANATHGLPRPYRLISQILETILNDPKWSKKTNAQIASHVKCSERQVSRIRNKGKEPEAAQTGLTMSTPESADYEPKTQKKEESHETKEVEMKDGVGEVIPYSLRERWLSRAVIRQRINELDMIKNSVKHSIEEGQLTYSLLNWTAFETDYKNLRNRLVAALPYALCCYCGGEGCGGCHNMGFLNEQSWKVAPKDLNRTSTPQNLTNNEKDSMK